MAVLVDVLKNRMNKLPYFKYNLWDSICRVEKTIFFRHEQVIHI